MKKIVNMVTRGCIGFVIGYLVGSVFDYFVFGKESFEYDITAPVRFVSKVFQKVSDICNCYTSKMHKVLSGNNTNKEVK